MFLDSIDSETYLVAYIEVVSVYCETIVARLGCTASATDQGSTKGFLQQFKFSSERTILGKKEGVK